MMSSMVRRVLFIGMTAVSVAAAAATLSSGQREYYRGRLGVSGATASAVPSITDPIAEAVLRWKDLQQTDSLPFTSYSGFLLSYPGWPGEMAMRRAAEKRIDATTSFAEIVRFFTRFPPLSNTGKARFAEALAMAGRSDEARAAARAAWVGGALAPEDESRLLGRFGSAFTSADHDQRMDRLLWDRSTGAAARQLALTSAAMRPAFDARLALVGNAPDAEARAAAALGSGLQQPGFVNDRARWLRDKARSIEARALLATPRTYSTLPLDAEKWLETLLTNARAAANDNQSTIAFDIASRADSAFPPGANIRQRSLGERDDYTSLVWLGGTTALRKLNRPRDAVAMFLRYASAAQTPQTQAKGYYWAGRAATAAGDAAMANGYFTQAAAFPDQFYGQLAGERLGRPAAVPVLPAVTVLPEQRQAFEASSIVRAARLLGELGAWREQSLFLRTIAQSATSDADHVMIADLSRAIQRPDLGVMVARSARNSGISDFVPTGFPQIERIPPSETGRWVMIHAITRQESQFDREAVSHAGARGLMQLMPGTAREQAGKLGLPYDFDRLTSDPSYNIMLGSSFFQRMLDYYGGNHVLAVASYNAGPGNVNKWLRAYGDPRIPGVDVIDWIESIPLSETRGYVQRVLENAVVYDALHPQHARMPERNRLSAYLGKRAPG